METIEAKYNIVTPMFLGDANQRPNDGIRPPSFKGALRFWWRALNWGRFLQASKNDKDAALKALHQKEAHLFGCAADGKGSGGQGIFLLTIKQPARYQTINNWPNTHTQRGESSKSGYLGLGLFPMGEHKRRSAIKEGQTFSANVIFRPTTSATDIEQIKQALTAVGIFGGLGSRSRRGFGSIALDSLNRQASTFQSLDDYKIAVDTLLDGLAECSQLPPYSAWSDYCQIGVDATLKANARAAHSRAGNRYINHRGQASTLRGACKKWFGLPLSGVSEERRSSPLFFHIHPIGESFTCLNLVMPASKLTPSTHATPTSYKDVHAFLDDIEAVYP